MSHSSNTSSAHLTDFSFIGAPSFARHHVKEEDASRGGGPSGPPVTKVSSLSGAKPDDIFSKFESDFSKLKRPGEQLVFERLATWGDGGMDYITQQIDLNPISASLNTSKNRQYLEKFGTIVLEKPDNGPVVIAVAVDRKDFATQLDSFRTHTDNMRIYWAPHVPDLAKLFSRVTFLLVTPEEHKAITEIVKDPVARKRVLNQLDSERATLDLYHQVLLKAANIGASDISIEPKDGDSYHIQYRIDGKLVPEPKLLTMQRGKALVSVFKGQTKLDLADHRIFQSGTTSFHFKKPDPADKSPRTENDERRERTPEGLWGYSIRTEIAPTIWGGEAASIRLSKPASVQSYKLERLGYSPELLRGIVNVTSPSHGIVLVAGSTNSGKSTTLYSVLQAKNDGTKKIITAEDPVEVPIAGIRQIQNNPDAGITFASTLRSMMRQDPDIILLGEIRDEETAGAAIGAAQTGHLVLSTVHASSAAAAFARLKTLNVAPDYIADTVIGVLSQVLVAKICPECVETYDGRSDVNKWLGKEIFKLSKDDDEGAPLSADALLLKRPREAAKRVGCKCCRGTGYKGLIPVAELLVVNRGIRDMLRSGDIQESKLESLARETGMTPLRLAAIKLVRDGVTSLEEVADIISPDNLIENQAELEQAFR